jgi:hypothetical protein
MRGGQLGSVWCRAVLLRLRVRVTDDEQGDRVTPTAMKPTVTNDLAMMSASSWQR